MTAADPLPPAATLDYELVAQVVGEQLAANDPDIVADLVTNALRWSLSEFDEQGYANVTVMHERGEMVATGSLHWRQLVARAKVDPARLRLAVDRWFCSLEDVTLYERMLAQIPEQGVDVEPKGDEFVVRLAMTGEPMFRIARAQLEHPAGTSEGWVHPGDEVAP